jgi:hypothetical protein
MFKTLCEELKLPGSILRNFDFKLTREMITKEPLSDLHFTKTSSSSSSSTSLSSSSSASSSSSSHQDNSKNKEVKDQPKKMMSLENAKAMLRTYAKLLNHDDGEEGDMARTRIQEADMIKLLKDDAKGRELWKILANEISFLRMNQMIQTSSSSSSSIFEMDFSSFAIALQRTRPKIAYDEGWFL